MADVVTRVTRKGQTTIPVEIRQKLGIREGDYVAWVRKGEDVVLRPAESVVRRTAGMARRYRQGPAPTIEEMKAAAAEGWVDAFMTEQQG